MHQKQQPLNGDTFQKNQWLQMENDVIIRKFHVGLTTPLFPLFLTFVLGLLLGSCSTFEKASIHGLNSGYYKLKSENKVEDVYVDVTSDKIDVYHKKEKMSNEDKFLSILSEPIDEPLKNPIILKKQGLDIDITSILLKYRPSVYGLPGQLTSDFNAALYAGWRFDNFKIVSERDPLGNAYHKIVSHGFDFGLLAGPGVTPINAFTTQNKSNNDYSGMTMQTGVAGFLETNMASFGMAFGFDFLMNSDRNIWIYQNQPWVGFIVGVALN